MLRFTYLAYLVINAGLLRKLYFLSLLFNSSEIKYFPDHFFPETSITEHNASHQKVYKTFHAEVLCNCVFKSSFLCLVHHEAPLYLLFCVTNMRPELITEVILEYLILKIEALRLVETSVTTSRHGITSQKAKVLHYSPHFLSARRALGLGRTA